MRGQRLSWGGCLFLSTLSLRRATLEAPARAFLISYFYPRSPCGERHKYEETILTMAAISIHALLAESDGIAGDGYCWHENFYPRSPCGERQNAACGVARRVIFLSTLSLRRATDIAGQQRAIARISIHALLAESDREPGCVGN